MTQKIGQGGQITLEATYSDGTGSLIDPGTPQIDIINPVPTTVITNAVPVRDGLGLYHYQYVVAAGAPLGLWTAHWTGTINSVSVGADEQFEVVVAGGIGFDPATLCSPEEAAALAGVTLTSGQLAIMQTLLEDWQAELAERLNRSLTVRTVTNEQVRVAGNGIMWPRYRPIVSVTALRDSTGAAQPTVTLDASGGIDMGTDQVGNAFFIDYTGGLDPTTARPVRSVLLARAARAAVKMHDNGWGITALTQEGYNAPYEPPGWTEQELQNIDRRRKRVVRT